jgi:hypothetical protein
MKARRLSCTTVMSTVFFLGLTISYQVFAQTTLPKQIAGPTLKLAVRPDIQKPLTKPVIPFRPFTLQELNQTLNLRPPATETTMITIPSSVQAKIPVTSTTKGNPYKQLKPMTPRTMQAGEIIKQLNVHERQLNLVGYTLRNRTTTNKIGELSVNRNLLADQKKRAESEKGIQATDKLKQVLVSKPSSVGIVNKPFVATNPLSPNPDAYTGKTLFVPFNQYDVRVFDGGDPNIVEGILYFNNQLVCDEMAMTYHGVSTADIIMLGKQFSMFNLDFTTSAPTSATSATSSRIATKASVFGTDISFVLPQKLNATGKSIQYPNQKTSYFLPPMEIQADFPVAPGISVTLKMGAGGEVGVFAGLNLNPELMSASAGPYLSTWIWAEAGADILGLADIGVGGNLRLIDDTLTINASASAKKDASARLYFQNNLSGVNDLNLLSGNLYIYLDILGSDNQYEIFSWEGLHYKNELFNYKSPQYYPNRDKILTLQLSSIIRGNEGNACTAVPGEQLISRSGQALVAQIWVKGDVPEVNKLNDLPDILSGYNQGHADIASFAWNAPTNGDVNLPIASFLSPFILRISLLEGDNCQKFSQNYVDDIAPGANKVLMLEYDTANHQFRGWSGITPPYLFPAWTPRGAVVLPKIDNPSGISFTLRDANVRATSFP